MKALNNTFPVIFELLGRKTFTKIFILSFQDDSDDDKYKISSDEDGDLPFKCVLCRDSFTNPIMTKCRHYFCEKCALQHYKKSQRCYACGAQTNGVFNPAKEIIARMEKMKQAAKIDQDDDDDNDDD